MLPRINPTTTGARQALHNLRTQMSDFSIAQSFESDSTRADRYTIMTDDLMVDYSKHLIDDQVMQTLIQLAHECKLDEAIISMLWWDVINETEVRSVLHTALRHPYDHNFQLWWQTITTDVHRVLEQMHQFCDQVINWQWKWYTGKPITTIVNIGIGGSDLGPVMVTQALAHYRNHLTTHFVSNIDGTHLHETLKRCDPETTLFLIASKTFTTQETMTNAHSARQWLLDQWAQETDIAKHFVAISTNRSAVESFGIDSQNMFEFWDWVGWRYSLWWAIGLSIMLSVWYDHFMEVLQWAHMMDQHFEHTPWSENIPVILWLLGIWYNNFRDAQTHAILPYDQYLNRFAAYFQQWDMESNGKSVDRNGQIISYQTGPIIWWEPWTNGQHAFYQLIHQWTKLVPCDFLGWAYHKHNLDHHHDILMSNFFAQTEALMNGKTHEQVRQELIKKGKSDSDIDRLTPYMTFTGNRPTTSILYRELTPCILGQLVAMYEHKIFVQWIIWNIYSFDQWWVELGKQLANKILPELSDSTPVTSHDSSTNQLINQYKKRRKLQ